MIKKLENKVAIVTGATKSKGLGKAIAVKLAELGAKVALTGRAKSKEGVEANVAEIKANGGEAMAVLVDVSDAAQVDAAVRQVADAWGRVDILVNACRQIATSDPLNPDEDAVEHRAPRRDRGGHHVAGHEHGAQHETAGQQHEQR